MGQPTLALAALALSLLPAQATTPRWKSRVIVLRVDDRAPRRIGAAELRAALRAAARAWQQTGCGPRIEIGAPVANRKAEPDGVGVVVFREDAWCRSGDPTGGCYDPDQLALTRVHPGAGGAPAEADIELNGIHHRWAALTGDRDERGRDHFDLQNALTHELGHVLGLRDNCGDGQTAAPDLPNCFTAGPALRASAMYPLGAVGQLSRRRVSEQDRAALCALYRP